MQPGQQARVERRRRLEPFEKTATRIAVGLVIAGPVLGMGAGILGAAEVYPYEYAATVAIAVMCSLIGVALLIGAVGGLYIMAGPKVAPFGVVFVAGFALTVLGLAVGNVAILELGVWLLALSCAVFCGVGFGSADPPGFAVGRWGPPIATVGGLALVVVGHLIGVGWLFLIGAIAAGCGVGIVLARWWHRHRNAE